MYVVERETSMWAAVSHPMVSHQVETNVVTQANRPPVTSREPAPAAPPRAAADDRQNSALGRVFRASVQPTCRTDRRRERPCACYSRLSTRYGQGRGTAPHPPGIVPGGRAGRGMAKGSGRRSWDLRLLGCRDRSDRAIPGASSPLPSWGKGREGGNSLDVAQASRRLPCCANEGAETKDGVRVMI